MMRDNHLLPRVADRPLHAGTHLMGDIDGTITQVFLRMRQGDEEAAGALWHEFFPRLTAIARSTLAGARHYVSDADDAVQSAFVAFWQQTDEGRIDGNLHRDDLWNLLALITKRKALKHLRREQAQKRGGGQVVTEANLPMSESSSDGLGAIAANLPAHEFDLICEELLEQLEPDTRTIVLLRLTGYRNREIADKLGCTERRVERKFDLARKTWRHLADDQN